MDLPLADPQFWIVTAAVAAAVLLAARRTARSLRASESPCASCPMALAHARAQARSRPEAEPRAGAADDRRLRLLAVALALLAAPAAAERAERRVAAMGTTLAVEVDAATRGQALAAAEELIAAVADAEARLSTWRASSELSRFNRAPVGETVALSAATFADLERAVGCAAATGGAFEPAIAPLSAAWGLRGGGRRPAAEELAQARAASGSAGRLDLEPAARTLVKRAPLRLDEGGFGKGAALGRALELAAARGVGARLDLGGQLAWTGSEAHFVALLADPRDRARPVVALTLDAAAGSLASSGNSEHAVTVGGDRIGHLIDPATGAPAPDFGSVAVLAADPLEADCRSTALFVLGPERGLQWQAAARDGAAVFLVVVGDRLVVRASSALRGRLRPLAADVVLEPET